MQFTTKIEKYKGKIILKIPDKVMKTLGIKIGDAYDISNKKGKIFIAFNQDASFLSRL